MGSKRDLILALFTYARTLRKRAAIQAAQQNNDVAVLLLGQAKEKEQEAQQLQLQAE